MRIRSTHDQEGGLRSGPLRISVKYWFTSAQQHRCRQGMRLEIRALPGGAWELRRVHGDIDLFDPGDAVNHLQPLRPNMSVGRLCLIKRIQIARRSL